jgi:hypothetical protein
MYGGTHADRDELDNYPGVYDDNGIVNYFRKDIAEGARQPPDRTFRVYAYIQGKEESRRGFGTEISPAYNLWREPKDLCLRLMGSNGAGGGFRTEWMYISERTLSEAIARAHLP